MFDSPSGHVVVVVVLVSAAAIVAFAVATSAAAFSFIYVYRRARIERLESVNFYPVLADNKSTSKLSSLP